MDFCGVKPCNVMLSMEKILGRNDFTWKELKQNDESVGIAFKGIGNDMYIFIFVTENYVTIMKIQEEAKNNLEDLIKIYKIVTEKLKAIRLRAKWSQMILTRLMVVIDGKQIHF